jgi:hypothetical protein
LLCISSSDIWPFSLGPWIFLCANLSIICVVLTCWISSSDCFIQSELTAITSQNELLADKLREGEESMSRLTEALRGPRYETLPHIST